MEKKLRVFVKWLKEHKETCFDSMHEGEMERRIRTSNDETVNKIGDMLEEILDMDDSQIDIEINGEPQAEILLKTIGNIIEKSNHTNPAMKEILILTKQS